MDDNIVYEFLKFQLYIKIYHWQTYQYSRHKSSDQLYEDFNKKMDEFIEIYMGYIGKRIDVKNKIIKLENLNDKKIVRLLKQFIKFLNKLKNLSTDLLNIRDEILGLIHQTLYLFTLT